MKSISFNIPCLTGKETGYIKQALKNGHISGNGRFTELCNSELNDRFGFKHTLLTSSGSAALEISAMLCNFKNGDEVILPAYTHVSTANAFVRCGATIKFADCLTDHPNVDAESVLRLISQRTKAIVIVHYAGIACDVKKFSSIAKKYNLILIEDAAHAIGALYNNRPLGTFGDYATFSFHETKNITSGQGGLLVVKSADAYNVASEIWYHGTNRIDFEKGKTSYYTWVAQGSEFMMPEINAAFLYPQLCNLQKINMFRMQCWQEYYNLLKSLEKYQLFRVPQMPEYAKHNAHIFYVILSNVVLRDDLLYYLNSKKIHAVFHYIPLHSSPYAKQNFLCQSLPHTEQISSRIIRLPLYHQITIRQIKVICDTIKKWVIKHSASG